MAAGKDSYKNKTPPNRGADGREMKRVAETEHDLIVEVPLVVGVDPIGVEPPRAVVVALDVEHVRVAIGVGYVRDTSCTTVRRIFSGLYRIWHHNALVSRTKYLLFF